ncbi:D-alanyl-D-alanine carboxypeptidase (penicillin-binding protein 5/6) [Kitasatospora sp. GAS204A]|uniref:D-alanyl-D-alanine carboxypeptidase family protein n=1 Tax=unclassified Kitasatospora TaxID=2633591 RepID=UPI002474EA91|nr:D-alanyl-D-alanine carboxypeptidase [Kitasatospora sp. GAS204B]MDH6118021.1 D-alanyl-D-alanine carboxypeptidase (penicillin-binding protein 5/6) [Kitasatospora sp. GAS204B]
MGDAPEKVQDGEREQPEADAAPPEGEGTVVKGGPTVQLRVRDADMQTTFLRLPEPEAAEPADAAEETPQAADPRLAMRTEPAAPVDEAVDEAASADVSSAERSVEPEPEPEPQPESAPSPLVLTPAAPAPAPLPPAPAPLPPVPLLPPAPPEQDEEAPVGPAAPSTQPGAKVRRVLKRAAVSALLLGVLAGGVGVAQLLRPLPAPQVKLTAATSYTFGGDPLALPWPAKGQAAAEVVGLGSLGSSGPKDTPVPIASVTKVMNAYLILRDHPLAKGQSGPMITVDQAAAQESSNVDQSTAKVTEGQQISEYEALEMLMLPSANNIARLLARWDAGSEDAFVKKMNDQAAKFGMTHTSYVDAAGYDANTKSTARDQLKLAEVVVQNDIFQQIVAEPSATIAGTKIINTNYLLNKNGVIGTKTGSSSPAGSCLMWAATKDVGGTRQLLLGVTLGQPQTATDDIVRAAQTVSSKIITAGQSALTGETLAKQGEVVGYLDDGLGGRLPVVATKDITVPGFTGTSATLKLTGTPGGIGHTAPAGTVVGTLTAGDGPGRLQVPVALQRDLAPPSIAARLARLH